MAWQPPGRRVGRTPTALRSFLKLGSGQLKEVNSSLHAASETRCSHFTLRMALSVTRVYDYCAAARQSPMSERTGDRVRLLALRRQTPFYSFV